jgi:hypothetical protein
VGGGRSFRYRLSRGILCSFRGHPPAVAADKALLLASIEAVADVHLHEAVETLGELADSDDDGIVTASRAMTVAKGLSDEDE